jgi:hypothetical protein
VLLVHQILHKFPWATTVLVWDCLDSVIQWEITVRLNLGQVTVLNSHLNLFSSC